MPQKSLNFSKSRSLMELPDLLEMQKKSFIEFLQRYIDPAKRKTQGLQMAFKDVFPIINADETLTLEFLDYSFGNPRYSENESIEKDITYSVPLKVRVRLLLKEKGSTVIKEISEQEVFIAEMPLMTDRGSFVINGAERVIVSQLHRSPGVIFEEDEEGKISSYGKKLYSARIIPYRGAWVEFGFDINNLLYVHIDKKRKILATVLLKALGMEKKSDILSVFYETEVLLIASIHSDALIGKLLAEDIVEKKSGEIIQEANKVITAEIVNEIKKRKIKRVKVVKWDVSQKKDVAISNTLAKDTVENKKEAVFEIYRKLRTQEFITPEQAENYLENLVFKNVKKYDLGKVGRYKINKKLSFIFEHLEQMKENNFKIPPKTRRTLCREDIIATIKYLVALNSGVINAVDDIDHLGNRRVRSVGELLENQIRIGLSHMSRLIKEKMNIGNVGVITPRTLINSAPVVGILRKFFGTSQLSQFMDQTNPLAEITHKRRLSALGPGGLNRKRAGFEVRDVHYTHYGRLCPIETPEGPNIGLIASLASYARINEYGLIESPYKEVSNKKVSNKIEYLTADREDSFVVAQANVPLDKEGMIVSGLVSARHKGDFPMVVPKRVNYMDISPMQVMSVSASLIPFLEHDDANRALMGSNMQRQAVPLLITESPLVATGMEGRVTKDSGATVIAKKEGKVISVTADRIIIWNEDKEIDVYRLKKFLRSNQDTCINQFPIIEKGERIRKGQVIADGPAISKGKIALGKNVLVAFMPWEGYNFEDAILISERLVKQDVFSSVHIQEFETEARDIKIGSEEITRDIPNVSEEALANLDERGIIREGAEVNPGDILVGKVTPRGEIQTTPEERLLKVIFGKKAEDVQDASLCVPPGVSGKVLDVKVFTRKEKRGKREENKIIKKLEEYYKKEIAELRIQRDKKVAHLEANVKKRIIRQNEAKPEIEKIKIFTEAQIAELKNDKKRKTDNVKMGDDLAISVNMLVKVFLVTKRKIMVGDKVAGRHGNKGVIAKILPEEDMPYLLDGTSVDVVLSPLSVPSRMNVGQILELMLGWAGKILDTEMVTPIFDGAREEDIIEQIKRAKQKLREAGVAEKYLPTDDCRITLYDGRTGEPFFEKVAIGYMYILKLAHLVEDKIHARSTGPYSLITRQPLGGKAQFGGQRFGEMEVWAVEGYGGAYILQEFLTVKSDDVPGRTKMYESIIKGEAAQPPGIPESFRVLVRELQSLGLNVELLKEKGTKQK